MLDSTILRALAEHDAIDDAAAIVVAEHATTDEVIRRVIRERTIPLPDAALPILRDHPTTFPLWAAHPTTTGDDVLAHVTSGRRPALDIHTDVIHAVLVRAGTGHAFTPESAAALLRWAFERRHPAVVAAVPSLYSIERAVNPTGDTADATAEIAALIGRSLTRPWKGATATQRHRIHQAVLWAVDLVDATETISWLPDIAAAPLAGEQTITLLQRILEAVDATEPVPAAIADATLAAIADGLPTPPSYTLMERSGAALTHLMVRVDTHDRDQLLPTYLRAVDTLTQRRPRGPGVMRPSQLAVNTDGTLADTASPQLWPVLLAHTTWQPKPDDLHAVARTLLAHPWSAAPSASHEALATHRPTLLADAFVDAGTDRDVADAMVAAVASGRAAATATGDAPNPTLQPTRTRQAPHNPEDATVIAERTVAAAAGDPDMLRTILQVAGAITTPTTIDDLLAVAAQVR